MSERPAREWLGEVDSCPINLRDGSTTAPVSKWLGGRELDERLWGWMSERQAREWLGEVFGWAQENWVRERLRGWMSEQPVKEWLGEVDSCPINLRDKSTMAPASKWLGTR